MQRHAFKMKLFPGREAEYKKRHDEIWPELSQLLQQSGIRNYSIHLDHETHILFGYLERVDGHAMDDLPNHPVMKKWWAYMKDIMAYDGEKPAVVPLEEVFYLE
jgi:L-rhamnose mutarotase